MMDVQPAAIISLVFCGLIQHITGICNVACTTDYFSSLNCSCATQAPAFTYELVAECWDNYDRVNGSCEIVSPQQWCIIEPENFELIVSIDTNCTAQARDTNSKKSKGPMESMTLILFKHVKPQSPFNVQMTKSDESYNISWETAYTENQNFYLNNFLIYRIRIREKDGFFKDPQYYTVNEDKRHLAIPDSMLEKDRAYLVDVQVTVTPSRFQAFWSEWSHNIEWRTKSDKPQLYLLLCLSVVPCLLFCYFGKIGLLKRMNQHHHIPSPEFFFRPLYHMYEGDFKKWVGPTVTLSDFEILETNMVVQVVKEKRWDPLEKICQRNSEDEHRRDSQGGQRMGSGSLLSISSHGSLEELSLSGMSQGATHSTGHISIHTVTVSGEEGASSDGFQDPYGGCQGHKDLFVYFGDCQRESLGTEMEEAEEVGDSVGSHATSQQGEVEPSEGLPGSLELYSPNWQLAAQYQALDRISLESFCSNEQSEDGYPHLGLDLDTIDSGFLESDCSSPVEFIGQKEMNAALLGEAEAPNTNYVRQWVTYAPGLAVRGDSSN